MYRKENHPLREKIYSKFPTMDSFCAVAGLDKTTIYSIMNKRTRLPNGYTIHKIADALNLSYQQVIDIISEV